MEPIRVIIHGASGKVGRTVTSGLVRYPELQIVGAVDKKVTADPLPLPETSRAVPFSSDLDLILEKCRPEVVVDFSVVEASLAAARLALKRGVRMVIGTTGFTPDNLAEIEGLAKTAKVGAVVAPNFALGAVVLMHLAKVASRFFDYAEIIELHHEEKADAPSGTALTTARIMAEAKGKPFICNVPRRQTLEGTRAGQIGGVTVHSVRLPGFVASQEVIFGGLAQTLSLRHDTTSRECYLPGIALAVKEIMKRSGLILGLDTLLNLEG